MEVSTLPKTPVRQASEQEGSPITLSPLLNTLLHNRELISPEEQEVFLKPDYVRDLHDPFLLKDMDKAVARILRAIKYDEKIVIFSDYDTDGIPGGVLMHDFFKKIGYKNFENYIPHRTKEGYGVNIDACSQFGKNGVKLMITVDCGISDNKPIAHARDCGIDVIVTDHHLPPEELPPAYAVINPHRKDDTYPFKMLCGAGVAWKLVCALIEEGKKDNTISTEEGWEKWLLDMAGFATIADMVPLTGENRALAHFGLRVLRQSPRLGLKQLLQKTRTAQPELTEDDVGFTIGPRINAASRLDIPAKAFALLTTEDIHYAHMLATELNELNEKRKGMVASVVREIKMRIKREASTDVFVTGNLNWNPGILGLAANHIAGEYERSVFLWGEGEDGGIKGSCRSYGSVHIVELMKKAEVFSGFGGHRASGGFSVEKSNLHLLEKSLASAYESLYLGQENEVEAQNIDAVLSLDEVTWNTHRDIMRLSPFGMSNPRPLFLFENIPVVEVSAFGAREEHTKLLTRDSRGRPIPAIQFYMKKQLHEQLLERKGQTMSLTAHIEQNKFRGRSELRLRIVGIKN
jgi:single-stranded-DNA-specific exonuclease